LPIRLIRSIEVSDQYRKLWLTGTTAGIDLIELDLDSGERTVLVPGGTV
jgi:hypothetical protein